MSFYSSLLYLSYLRIHGNRNYLGCCLPPPVIIAVDEPASGLKIQGRAVKKVSNSEDCWSTRSYHEIDNSTFQSQISISSNQRLEPSTSSGSTEFINHGLVHWNQIRQQWLDKKGSENHKEAQDHDISRPGASYDSLGATKPFPTPIQLPEVINSLVDTWKQEGLYDCGF